MDLFKPPLKVSTKLPIHKYLIGLGNHIGPDSRQSRCYLIYLGAIDRRWAFSLCPMPGLSLCIGHGLACDRTATTA